MELIVNLIHGIYEIKLLMYLFYVLFISYDKFRLNYTLIHWPTYFPVTGTVGQADIVRVLEQVLLKKRWGKQTKVSALRYDNDCW